jgi:hypothetical protein
MGAMSVTYLEKLKKYLIENTHHEVVFPEIPERKLPQRETRNPFLLGNTPLPPKKIAVADVRSIARQVKRESSHRSKLIEALLETEPVPGQKGEPVIPNVDYIRGNSNNPFNFQTCDPPENRSAREMADELLAKREAQKKGSREQTEALIAMNPDPAWRAEQMKRLEALNLGEYVPPGTQEAFNFEGGLPQQ